jgi:predicted DNA binding CopG/RHH family protein
MHKILDKTKVNNIIEMIEKENQVYQEYESFKQKDFEDFKNHHEYKEVRLDPEEDPRIKAKVVVEVEEDD